LEKQQISRTAIHAKPLILLDFRHIHAPTPERSVTARDYAMEAI
jgi:hypothetical protein